MKIAVTSQNFRTITGHAGKTQRFLVYEADAAGEPIKTQRLDLPKEMAFHEFHGDGPHPLDVAQVVITQGAGMGFVQRLAGRGIRVVTTSESDPLQAVRAVLRGSPLAAAEPHDQGHHQHRHGNH